MVNYLLIAEKMKKMWEHKRKRIVQIVKISLQNESKNEIISIAWGEKR